MYLKYKLVGKDLFNYLFGFESHFNKQDEHTWDSCQEENTFDRKKSFCLPNFLLEF